MTKNPSSVSRRIALSTAGAAATAAMIVSSCTPDAQESPVTKPVPKLKRIKMATLGVPDLGAIAPLYGGLARVHGG